MQVRSLVGLWRGLARDQVGDVPDDEVTQLGIELGCCEQVEGPPADTEPEELPQEPQPPAPEVVASEPAAEQEPVPEPETTPARRRGRKEAR